MLTALLLTGALAVPTLPQKYSLILKWNRPGGYEYMHQEAFDLTNQKLSDSQLENNTVVTRTMIGSG